MANPKVTVDSRQHRRLKSSVLSNISFIQKRIPSSGSALTKNLINKKFKIHENPDNVCRVSSTRPRSMVLEERYNDQRSQQRPTNIDTYQVEGSKSLKKKSLSSLSLKSQSRKDRDPEGHRTSEPKRSKLSKPKSSSNFVNLLSRPKSLINLNEDLPENNSTKGRNKENDSGEKLSDKPQTPIYAKFSSEHYMERLENEINLYTPKDYTPRKQRNFFESGNRPTLGKQKESQPRPRSTYLPGSFSIQDLSRRVSEGSRHSAELIRRVSGKEQRTERKASSTIPNSDKSERIENNRGQRNLVSLNRSLDPKTPKVSEEKTQNFLNEGDINTEFEAMLDRRNIPDHQRGKMRSLALSMKKDFIKQDWAEIAALKSSNLVANDIKSDSNPASNVISDLVESRKKRPRSRTFTLSRSVGKELNISSKNVKPETTAVKNLKKKSCESLNGGGKLFVSAGAAAAYGILAKAKGQTPDDYVSYLIRVQKPEKVEVGRLHKLRLLLRIETVAWTDNFIRQGGMEEIVGLLRRTMAIEWRYVSHFVQNYLLIYHREEHEDALLHEILLCLKGLSTTALAMKCLENIQGTLFPALIRMLFDEEKKGPSEFTTRNIITSLLFTYLKSALISEREKRAKTLLSYLQDPELSESQRPIGFVLEMRRPRPYRMWCKEVVNVTKEVFWIFLHNLNVIPLPGARPTPSGSTNGANKHTPSALNKNLEVLESSYSYMNRNFPQERKPTVTAPYVGGVEWDATNYLASHLDLVNGILACHSSPEERNLLREQMSISGWEKCMGGTLRLCKEKFYGNVHEGLICWVAAATDDGWNTKFVRCGPSTDNESNTTEKKSLKRRDPIPPKISLNIMTDNETKLDENGCNWL